MTRPNFIHTGNMERSFINEPGHPTDGRTPWVSAAAIPCASCASKLFMHCPRTFLEEIHKFHACCATQQIHRPGMLLMPGSAIPMEQRILACRIQTPGSLPTFPLAGHSCKHLKASVCLQCTRFCRDSSRWLLYACLAFTVGYKGNSTQLRTVILRSPCAHFARTLAPPRMHPGAAAVPGEVPSEAALVPGHGSMASLGTRRTEN